MKKSAQEHAAGEQQSWDLNPGILSPKLMVVITTQASRCLPGSCSLINRNPPQLAARVKVIGVGVPWGLIHVGWCGQGSLPGSGGRRMSVRRCDRAGDAGWSAGEGRHTAPKSGHLGQAPLALGSSVSSSVKQEF